MFAGEEKGSRPLRVASCCAGGDPCLWVARRRGRAVAVFRIAFERWTDETNQQDLPRLIRESLDALKAVTAGR